MAAKSVYFFSEVMEMVLDYMVSKKDRVFEITEPLVAWVGGDPLGAVLRVTQGLLGRGKRIREISSVGCKIIELFLILFSFLCSFIIKFTP
jgi:hypothetical protein